MNEFPEYEIPEDEMIEIKGPEDFPEFANEDEEDAFWSTHCIGPDYIARVGELPPEERPANVLRRVAGTPRAH